MKFIKKNIYKILITLSLCLTLVLTLTFTTKTYADTQDNNPYEILPNSIKSKNLFGGNTSVVEGVFSGGNFIGNVSTNTSASYYVYRKDNGTNVTLQANTNSGRYNITFEKYSYSTALSLWVVGNRVDQYVELDIRNFENGNYTLSATFYKNTITRVNINQIMLVKGTTPLNYYPYGTYQGNNEYDWNEDVLQENENLLKNSTTALYNALNGAYAELIGRNGTILASGNCTIEENTRRFEIQNLPISFSNYYNNYDSENENYYTRPDIKIYLNYTVTNSLLFSFTDTQLDRTITLQNSNNTNSVTASNGGNEDMIDPYTLIINKENIGYDIIYYSGIYIPDYWNINFNISFDAYTYSQGYTKGVESQQTKINIAEGNANYYRRLYEQTNTNYEELQERYNQINENGNTLYGMIVAIADTPINIFKQIFNFDILGINISGVVFGLISLLVIIWLIKKLI